MASIRKTQTTNQELFDLIRDLKKLSTKTGSGVYRAVATKLSSTASQRPEVNLSKIERNTQNGETVIIPGKVLGSGLLSKKVTIVGFSASESALIKIKAAGSTFVELSEFIKKPSAKVTILG